MAGSNIYDQIINDSFDAVGAPPSYISPPYNPADYASIYAKPNTPTFQPGMLGRGQPSTGSPYMTASERAMLEQQVAASKALQAAQGQTPTAVANVPLPRIRPAWAPSVIDLAAISQQPAKGSLDELLAYAKAMPDKYAVPATNATAGVAKPVTNVTAPLKAQPGGGLLDLIFGPSKNGQRGLAGLLGGPQAGGLFGMLSEPRAATPAQAYAAANQPRQNTATGTSTNGYVYSNGQRVGVAPQYAGMSPSQMYDAINAAAGNRSSTSNSGSRDPESQARANYSMASNR